MKKQKLWEISYSDDSIFLKCYADTLIYEKTGQSVGKLIGIRFGGYPEQVRAMSDAIYGGGTVEVRRDGKSYIRLTSLTKQYQRSQSMDGVYAEATLFAKDDEKPVNEATEEQTLSRQNYIFTPIDNRERLFEEIDKGVEVPLIPQFSEYLIDSLISENQLQKLTVDSVSERFEAWRLTCKPKDSNIVKIIEDGLKGGIISIPQADGSDYSVFDEITTVSGYLREFGVSIAERIKSRFVPLFDFSKEQVSKEIVTVNRNIQKNTGYQLYDAQLISAEGLKRKLDKHDPALLIAECGAGKTKIGMTALYASHLSAGKEKTFNIVLCPAHVAKKWCREVEETIPNSFACVVKSISDLEAFYDEFRKANKTAFAIISKEKARDGYMHIPSATWSRSKRAFLCPECNAKVMTTLTEDGTTYQVPVEHSFFQRQNSKNHKCSHCKQPMWTVLNPSCQSEWVKLGAYGFAHRKFIYELSNSSGVEKYQEQIDAIMEDEKAYFKAVGAVRRFSLSKYIRLKMKGKIDGCIVDELHQYAQNSGQGDAMGDLVRTAGKVVGMTATLINGYSAGIFQLLYRLFPNSMLKDNKSYMAPDDFNREYGVVESVYEMENSAYNANRRSSKRKKRERQLPGVSPLVYSRFLMENAVFLSLSDMGKNLPEYEEIPIALELEEEIATEYKRIEGALRQLLTNDKKAAKKILSTYMNLLTVYPDQPYGHEPIVHPIDGETVVEPKELYTVEDYHLKELKAIEITKEKLAKGEKVLIYASWTRIDSQQKLLSAFLKEGISAKVLEAKVAAVKREEWVEKELEKGLQVLICNPAVVETGLDLNAFTTLIYYNIGYNLFTLRQSSRRSWRINQTAPRVEVYFLYYKNVMQQRAMELMASKLAVAGLVEGNFSDEGLAAMSNCQDITSQMARELASGIKENAPDVGEVFKRISITHKSDNAAMTALVEENLFMADFSMSNTFEILLKQQINNSGRFISGIKNLSKPLENAAMLGNQMSLFDLPKSA